MSQVMKLKDKVLGMKVNPEYDADSNQYVHPENTTSVSIESHSTHPLTQFFYLEEAWDV